MSARPWGLLPTVTLLPEESPKGRILPKLIFQCSASAGQALSTFTVVALNKDTGSMLWNVPIIGTAPYTNEERAVVSDPSTGAMIAVGVTQNDRTSFDMTVASITEGHEGWRRVITGPGKRVDRDDAGLAIAAYPRRNSIALAGYAQNTAAGLLGMPHEFRMVKIRNKGTSPGSMI
jgi:hypothetical protein